MPGDVRRRMFFDLVVGGRRPGTEHDDSMHLLAPHVVGDAVTATCSTVWWLDTPSSTSAE